MKQPKMNCPKCNAEYDDNDGFGVLYCPKCGYCTHASINGDICGLCKKKMAPQPKEFYGLKVTKKEREEQRKRNQEMNKRIEYFHPNDWEKEFCELYEGIDGDDGAKAQKYLVPFICSLLAHQRDISYKEGYANGFMNGAQKGFTKEQPLFQRKELIEKIQGFRKKGQYYKLNTFLDKEENAL